MLGQGIGLEDGRALGGSLDRHREGDCVKGDAQRCCDITPQIEGQQCVWLSRLGDVDITARCPRRGPLGARNMSPESWNKTRGQDGEIHWKRCHCGRGYN